MHGGKTDANVVIDTNVFVAAGFNADSHAAALLDGVRQGTFTMVWNDETRAETERVLKQIPPLAWSDFAKLFTSAGRYTGKTDKGRFALVEDPTDRKFAALAAATESTLVSNDDHLLSVRDEVDFAILTPRAFMGRHGHR